jgi:hypothetical protein
VNVLGLLHDFKSLLNLQHFAFESERSLHFFKSQVYCDLYLAAQLKLSLSARRNSNDRNLSAYQTKIIELKSKLGEYYDYFFSPLQTMQQKLGTIAAASKMIFDQNGYMCTDSILYALEAVKNSLAFVTASFATWSKLPLNEIGEARKRIIAGTIQKAELIEGRFRDYFDRLLIFLDSTDSCALYNFQSGSVAIFSQKAIDFSGYLVQTRNSEIPDQPWLENCYNLVLDLEVECETIKTWETPSLQGQLDPIWNHFGGISMDSSAVEFDRKITDLELSITDCLSEISKKVLYG